VIGGAVGGAVGGGLHAAVYGGSIGESAAYGAVVGAVTAAALYGGYRAWQLANQPADGTDQVRIARAISQIERTEWSTTEKGSQVIEHLKLLNQDRRIRFGDLPGDQAGMWSPVEHQITVNRALSESYLPGVLAHEGYHATHNIGVPSSFSAERGAFAAQYAVESHLRLPHAVNRSDWWIRFHYRDHVQLAY
jgi:hypothetical protein